MRPSLLAAAAAVLLSCGSTLGDERLIVENFDDPAVPFNPRYTHDFFSFAGIGPLWEVRSSFGTGQSPLPSPALNLAGADTLAWDAEGMGGDQVLHAGVRVWNHDSATTATVTFHGVFADAAFEAAPNSTGYVAFEVTNDTIGIRPFPSTGEASLGPIVAITLRSPGDADFDDIFVSINHKHCVCDSNQDNEYDVFDLLTYLDWWFTFEEAADFNEDTVIDVFDLLDFLNCWFDPAGSGLRFCP